MNQERAVKHARLAGWLDRRGLAGVVLTRRCNFSWYTGGAHNHVGEACDVGVSSLVVTGQAAVVVASNIEATRLAGEDVDEGLRVVEYAYHAPAERGRAFAEAMGGGRFAADAPLEGLEIEATDEEFDRLRWQLTGWEVERYRVLCRETAECVEHVARGLEPGAAEGALAGSLAGELRSRGITPWVLLVGSDERIDRHRHPLPTARAVERRAMLVTCGERGGLIAAVSRLVSLGEPSAELRRRHQAVAAVDAAMISATLPGVTLGEVFDTARTAYGEVGFADEWRQHHQGGSIGYLPREVKASPGCRVEALAGQPFAWNASITGTKCEDTILCTEGGPEVLTHTGEWPTIEGSWRGCALPRPDVLVL